MMLIPCPLCGARSVAEFAFDRPVEAIVPLEAPAADALARLYERTNPRGASAELWRHAHGCRAFLRVERDTASHEILAVSLWGEKAG